MTQWICLFLCLFTWPGGPEGRTFPAPRLAVGEEFVYLGEVVEACEKFDNRFRKKHQLEVRLLVLEVGPGFADCALLTRLKPQIDPVITALNSTIIGGEKSQVTHSALVQMQLVRVDSRGRVMELEVPVGPPPLQLGSHAKTVPFAPISLDTLTPYETGFFVPLPLTPPGIPSTWDSLETDRPPTRWQATGENLWNGGRVLEVLGTQQTDGWDRPADVRSGWHRRERVLVNPVDGTANAVERRIERRVGKSVIGWLEVKYELQPTSRLIGARLKEVRYEAEYAHFLAEDLERLIQQKSAPKEYQIRGHKIQKFLADHPATSFREAILAVEKRYQAAGRGEFLTLAIKPTELNHTLAAGSSAPDFVAPAIHEIREVRLSALRGQPTVLVFYRPSSKTSTESLAVLQALEDKYKAQVNILGLSLMEEPATAVKQRQSLKLSATILDGRNLRDAYRIETYPQFFVLDAAGKIAFRFEGIGPETGYLVREQLDKMLATKAGAP